MAARSKRYQSVMDLIEATKAYSVKEAISIIKKSKKLKFDETLDIAINLGVDPKHADQIVKGVVKLPHGTGKMEKIAVFAKEEKAKEAKDAGADFVGSEDLAQELEKNEINGDELKHLLSERNQEKIKFLLVDVREEYEYNEKKIVGTDYLIPLSDFFNKIKQLEDYKSNNIVVMCKLGGRSAQAQTQLKMMEFNNTINLSGGITYYNGKVE